MIKQKDHVTTRLIAHMQNARPLSPSATRPVTKLYEQKIQWCAGRFSKSELTSSLTCIVKISCIFFRQTLFSHGASIFKSVFTVVFFEKRSIKQDPYWLCFENVLYNCQLILTYSSNLCWDFVAYYLYFKTSNLRDDLLFSVTTCVYISLMWWLLMFIAIFVLC